MSVDVPTAFGSLWSDIAEEDSFPNQRPLLAHYTSIETLERIMANDEMWFSNPLYMNDIEELRFGMNESAYAFRLSVDIEKACETEARYQILLSAYERFLHDFETNHAFDTYVLCFSMHEQQDTDGLLSMWRGYGGNGKGAAIVFDSKEIEAMENSPLIVSSVTYASRSERLAWIDRKLSQFATLLTEVRVPDEQLFIAAHALLERIKVFALFTKHSGFREEKEWRIVYMNQQDQRGRLNSMLSYSIGPRGLEPKLKLKLAPIDGVTAIDFSLEKLIHQIILGPSVSSPLSVKAIHRMLAACKKDFLISKVTGSTTPYRAPP